ncbi:MAG: Rv1355c family protein, partial [Polyangiaceae bacterium]
NTDVARRIALGKFRGSGRFFVDIEDIVSGSAREPLARAHPSEAPPAPERARSEPPGRQPTGSIARATYEELLRLATLAPSGGNCQPWRFRAGSDVLQCFHDVERSRSLLDFEHRATYAAFGALSENLRLGAARLGIGIELRSFPRPDDLLLVCEAKIGGSPETLSADDERLASLIEARVTNRKLSKRVALPAAHADRLRAIAANAGAELHLVTKDDRLDAIGDVLGMCDRLRLMSPVMHREMMGELRWTKRDVARTRDGLDVHTLELTPTDEAGMRLISDWSVMDMVREIDGGHGLAKATQKAVAASSAVGLISIPRRADASTRDAYFAGGIALQRAWLAAHALGHAFQPMTALIYLFARLEEGRGDGLDAREKHALAELRLRFREIFDLPDASAQAGPRAEVMLFRLAIADPPTTRSLRRNLGDILELS